MSQLQNVQSAYLPKIKEEKTVTKRTGVLWIGFLAFGLIALVAYLTVPTNSPIIEANRVTSYSINPELSIAGRYADDAPVSVESVTCSANPELSIARRYAVAAPISAEINTFSIDTDFDYGQAAKVTAFRWNAIAEGMRSWECSTPIWTPEM